MAQFLSLLILFLVPITTISAFRVELRNIDSESNLTLLEFVRRSALHDVHRLSVLQSASLAGAGASVPIHLGPGVYVMDFSIGTPPQPETAALDTTSDFFWTQCKPCTTCFPQSTPIFDPKKSKTYKKIPCTSPLCKALPKHSCSSECMYSYRYDSKISVDGVLANDTLTFGKSTVKNIGFGCTTASTGEHLNTSGIVGLGRGKLSLMSQLKATKFSYCFTSYVDPNQAGSSSTLAFGSSAKLTAKALSTPFVASPKKAPMSSSYYLSLKGITVGGTQVPIPKSAFELKKDGKGGVVVDVLFLMTYLIDEAYQAVRKQVVEEMTLEETTAPEGLDLCFAVPPDTTSITVPSMVFNFEGADMKLSPYNYFVMLQNGGENIVCLTMNKAPGITVIGNFQQQSMHVLYDLGKGVFSFEEKNCTTV